MFQVQLKNIVAFSEKLQILRNMLSSKESDKGMKSLLCMIDKIRCYLGYSDLKSLSNHRWVRCFLLPMFERGKEIKLKPYPTEIFHRLLEIKIELRRELGKIFSSQINLFFRL